MIIKVLAVAVIILFLGLAIQPSVAVQPNTSNVEDDCKLCAKKVSNSHFVLIESLLNRLERYDTQLSVLSKLNPEFEEKYQELLVIITELQDLNPSDEFCEDLNDFGFIFWDIGVKYFDKFRIILGTTFCIIASSIFIFWAFLCLDEPH